MKSFKNDFFLLLEKLKTNEHFAFSRYSDGEMFIMQNIEVKLDNGLTQVGNTRHGCLYSKTDWKHFDPNKHQQVKDLLIDSFKHQQHSYFKGISCPCCVGSENAEWMKKFGNYDPNMTWANLFVNSNFELFIEYVIPLFKDRKIVLVSNEQSKPDSDFNIVKWYPVGYNAMVNNLHYVDHIKSFIQHNNIKDHLFLFSAASLSNILIHQLFKEFPDNTYIDIGTAAHKYLGLPLDRDYLRAYYTGNNHPDLYKTCVW